MGRRKCFIGIVAFKGVESDILQNYLGLAFHLGRRLPDIDFMLRVIGKKEQFRARNNLVSMAQSVCTGDNDLLLMLDDDMVFPIPYTAFERMLEALDARPDAGVMGALYWQRGGAYKPVIQKIVKDGDAYGTAWYAPHEITGDVMQVGVTGGGILLFPMRAINSLMPPVFWVDGIVGTDIHMCLRLNQAGWNVYCHTGIEIGHLDQGKILTAKTIPPYLKKYSEYCKDLEESACEYLRMDRMELETYQYRNMFALETIWSTKPRGTFEEIADAYTSIKKVAVARNVYYAIHHNVGSEGFADLLDDAEKGLIRKNFPILDYGCGVGVATEILAREGYQVEAMDLAGTAVLDFLKWRLNKAGEEISERVDIKEVVTLRPKFQEKYSGIVMTDVLEHLMNPKEILNELLERLEPGGHFHTNFHVTDFKGAEEGIHQHLKLITLDEFYEICKNHGLISVGTFLFQKEKG